MTPPLLIDRTGHVETWSINRPEQRNPVTDDAVIDALVGNVDRVNADLEVHAVIITGVGTAFSAGGNVKDMAARRGMFGGSADEVARGYRRGVQRIPRALHACEVPLIAAVNGPAIGAGCDLALLCDIRVASERAGFAESFVKLGLISGDGGTWILPRAIGWSRAAEMALTGDRIDAATALEWGLVSRVVAPEALLDAAMEVAQRIAANPTGAVRTTKRLLRESQAASLDSVLELASALQGAAHQTAEHRQAMDALLQRSART